MKLRDQVNRDETYREYLKTFKPLQTCPVCGESGSKKSMDPHHPAGRSGMNMFKVFYVDRHCHNAIHDDVEWAEKNQLLWPGRNTQQMTTTQWAEMLRYLKIENQ